MIHHMSPPFLDTKRYPEILVNLFNHISYLHDIGNMYIPTPSFNEINNTTQSKSFPAAFGSKKAEAENA